MPIHDWTRVRSNRFHDFHQSWTVAIRNALNAGQLPPGYFAMVEQQTGGPEPDIITLELNPPVDVSPPAGLAISTAPPKARFVTRTEAAGYAHKANRITVRHPDGDVVHLLIVDLFPPSRRDPQGIHKVIWDRIRDEPFQLPPDKPLTVAAYAVGTEIVAYIEPLAVGDLLPDMPIFLTADRYVPCPLEAAYQIAWEQFPAPLKGPLEPPPIP